MTEKTFNEVITNHFEKLELFTTAITRAHGKNHPEAFEVRELFERISEKVNNAEGNKPNLHDEFNQLRKITDHFPFLEMYVKHMQVPMKC
ncbi:hypothetical protein [Gracilibacillus kekensis]|uniref:Regulator of cell morphogenesis and NO signaling n=1 Tax=Gracilibacillus kekensis TaxID=1027249 RepID=A0A1M7Q6X3_9BACI|nr:hypothetical protein [Gracilibacillus kekensis]SHN26284.1 regulator of cell morphogenesis and NO signaling [Gracilibacillus kekensis]